MLNTYRLLIISLIVCAFSYGSEPVTTIDGVTSPFRIRSVFVMPGQSVLTTGEDDFSLAVYDGDAVELEANTWSWTAPEKPGLYKFEIRPEDEDDDITLVNAFVMTPYSSLRKGSLKGYRIGSYPAGEGTYARPKGFVEVTPENQDTWISPHFQLKQFMCKQSSLFPKFVVLREALVTKLEHILTKLKDYGFEAPTLSVLSGFRTPAYNRSLGNVSKSRHMFGDAADIYVDTDGDDRMDDLNGDGKSSGADSEFLKQVVLDLEANEEGMEMGGIGLYNHSHNHGPFVHVDARGHTAQWTAASLAKSKRAKARANRRTKKRSRQTASRS